MSKDKKKSILTDRNKAIAAGIAAASAGLLGATVNKSERAAGEEVERTDASASPAAKATVDDYTAWDLPSERNERIDYWIDFLAGDKHERTGEWLERIGKYGPMIRAELQERGMPNDLLYLAIIESGLEPHAYSHAHASGMWQFIKETGQRYGLEVSRYVDERNDPVKATGAALSYLQDLADRFEGSYFLAAASYNTGENRVERILREQVGGQKGDDALFWRIAGHLPRETRDYVPLMIAMGHIAKDPEAFGYHDVRPMEPFAFEEVMVPRGTQLSDVAEAAGVDALELEQLNAHLVRKMTPPDRDMPVRLPPDAVKRFAANFPQAGGTVASFGP